MAKVTLGLMMVFAVLLKGNPVVNNDSQKARADKAPEPDVPLVDLCGA
jgi:hypothetical protein